jgi:hypothetical protein
MMGSAFGLTVILLATAISALVKSFVTSSYLTGKSDGKMEQRFDAISHTSRSKHSRELVHRMPLRKGSRKLYRVGSTL